MTLAPPCTAYLLTALVTRYGDVHEGADGNGPRGWRPGAFAVSLARWWTPLVDDHEGEPVGIAVAYQDTTEYLAPTFWIPADRARMVIGKTQFSIGARYPRDQKRGEWIGYAELYEVAAAPEGACPGTRILDWKATDRVVEWEPSTEPIERDDYKPWVRELAAAEAILERLDRERAEPPQ